MSSAMRVRVKYVLQALLLCCAAALSTLCLYRSLRLPPADKKGSSSGSAWQERAPRSLSFGSRDYEVVSNGQLLAQYDTNELQQPLDPAEVTPALQVLTSISDVFISVKTTSNYHKSRLDVLLKTWFTLAREETWFFSDSHDPEYQERTNGHLINTNCSSSHNRKALCCKMSVEFDTFLRSDKKWFCHFDDDNYVNIPKLLSTLGKYSPQEDWYLGKPSIRTPLEILDREKKTQSGINRENIKFWFATGGAGFCISRALALKMSPAASGGRFISVCEKIRLPDDVTIGYIIEHLLKKKLTFTPEFHSHLEPMKFIQQRHLPEQITFSYSGQGKDQNVLKIEGLDPRIDPTRFMSLHCYLFPHYSFCPR
ncbi:fringe glycosyltransferase [Neocloeon triangulifer]|uniref:fringe glycosyltransferase n=1 Tax=Neocloeon triangulifer TaxID=2078957 RepID=UPI00286EBC24|nr:fringe glycosyltransferase [Neocloeon triangulifer]